MNLLDKSGLTYFWGKLKAYFATKTELSAKQDALTFDSTPTSGSTNPVTSGGVSTALGNYMPLSDGVTLTTAQSISGEKDFSSGLLTISTPTTGAPTLLFKRGTDTDAYVDWAIVCQSGYIRFRRKESSTDIEKIRISGSGIMPVSSVTSTVSDLECGSTSNRWNAIYAKRFYPGGELSNAYLSSDSATNIFLSNSSGSVLVCDGKVVRRGSSSSLDDTTLGNATYPWGGVYSTSFIKPGGTSSQFLKADGSVDSNTYATKTSDLINDAPFLKYVLLNSESDMPASPDSGTLYLIPE